MEFKQYVQIRNFLRISFIRVHVAPHKNTSRILAEECHVGNGGCRWQGLDATLPERRDCNAGRSRPCAFLPILGKAVFFPFSLLSPVFASGPAERQRLCIQITFQGGRSEGGAQVRGGLRGNRGASTFLSHPFRPSFLSCP